MSSGRCTSVARPAQYTPARASRPTVPSASVNVSTLSTGAATPAPRRTRPKAVARAAASANGAAPLEGVAHEVGDPGLAHPLLILAVLEDGAEGGRHRAFAQLLAAQDGQRCGPVDRLGHARRLVEPHPPQRLDGGGDLASEPVGHLRRPETHDGDLTLEAGVLHPVVEAAPLQ